MKKVLYVATSDVHIYTFHLPYLKWLKENGCEVHLAVENRGNYNIPYVDQFFFLPFPCTPFDHINFTTYKKLKSIIEINNYDLVHCHTPIPSVITRLASVKARKTGTKVLYTAHGFHFYKGCSLKYWLTYYPVEWILSSITDGIITINKEDYSYINRKMWHKDSYYIKGIGIDSTKFSTLHFLKRNETRKTLGYEQKDFILLYVAEFIFRKNHQFIIDALPELANKIPHLKIIFAGKGILLEKMKTHALKLGVENAIDFLGFINNVEQYAAIADIGISSSRQEGLGLGLAEEMLCSVPIIASIDKGHKEMIDDGINGYFFAQGDKKRFIASIVKLYDNPELRKQMGKHAFEKAQEFKIENSLNSMTDIYNKYLKD